MVTEISFKDVKIGTMFLYEKIYCVKTGKEFAEYSPGKEFYFHDTDIVTIDDRCKDYNEGLKHETE